MPRRSTGHDNEQDVPLHIIKPDQSAAEQPLEVTAYGWADRQVEPEAPEALAKEVFDPNSRRTRYYLKRATTGPESGSLFNPQSPNYNPDALRLFQAQLGRGRYEFRQASRDAFDYYRQFLRTGNLLFLRHAERS